jgi:phosphonate transport system substrate-binding protein
MMSLTKNSTAATFTSPCPIRPYQTLNSLQHGYHIFAKMGEDDRCRGIIIVRKDSNINTVADLMGKIVSFLAPTVLAATMMPLY